MVSALGQRVNNCVVSMAMSLAKRLKNEVELVDAEGMNST